MKRGRSAGGPLLACEAVHDTCQHAVHDCLKKGGADASLEHIGGLLDCAQIAHTAHDFMLRHSANHEITYRVCAEICDICAQMCDDAGDGTLSGLCRILPQAPRHARLIHDRKKARWWRSIDGLLLPSDHSNVATRVDSATHPKHSQ